MTPSDLAAALSSLAEGAAALGIPLDARQRDRFGRYLQLLERWSRALRLTGLRDPQDWIETHFLDSLTALRVLGDPRTLLDIGSGAGFPGAPLAIVRPAWHVTLLEAHAKKAAFLRALVAEIALANVTVHEARVEANPEPSFDAVICRAVWPPEEWLPRGSPWLAPGGRIVAMLGREVPSDEELCRLGARHGLEVQARVSLRLPFSGAARTLVAWDRRAVSS